MDAFKGLSAAATVADKKDQICGRAWIATQNLLSMQPGHYFNVCIKVVRMDTASHGLAAVVNLKLGNSIDDSPVSRQPQLTGEEIQMDCSARKQRMLPEQVYMVVGAKMMVDGEDIYMKLPPTTDSRACILLPTREDAIVGVAEIFCGGINGWSRACRQLPAYPVIRVDHCGMSIANTLLNDPAEILYNEHHNQSHFSVFWGEAIDLRWTDALHHSNIEVLCASPPSHAWNATNAKNGFQDTVNTVAWWELAVIARLTQRRVVAVEATLAFGSHGDAATFESVMKWAGYQIAWKGRVDTKLEVPTDRPKYFMVFWNSADQPSASTPFRMLRLGPYGPIPCEDCIWKPMRPDMFQATEVKKEMMAKVTSRELLPPYQKRLVGSPVHLSLVNPNAPMPSVPMSYNRLLNMAWPVLMKTGMQLPLVEQDGKLRLLSKWELARAAGLPGDLILPEPESDANLLLCQATLPCQALQVLGSIIAHRQEMVMTEDTLLRYYETGLKECSKGWEKFSQLEPFARATWATLISNGDEAQMGTEGRLRSRLRLLQQQLDNMVRGRPQQQAPFLPETCRTMYEELEERMEEMHSEHRIFQVGHGYTGMLLDEEEPTAVVHEKIAEFLAVPAHLLAVARVDSSATRTRNWVVAGEMLPHLFDEVIVLVDTGIPQAQWLPSELEQRHLSKTYGDHHASYPDSVEINGYQVLQWPASLASGDFIRLRWNGYSDHEDWKDLDVFDHMDANEEDIPPPPPTPPGEGAESSPGGQEDDPHDGSDTEPMPDTPPGSPRDTPAVAEDAPTRGMPFQDMGNPAPKRPRTDFPTLMDVVEEPAPTINYSPSVSSQALSMTTACYMKFQGQVASFANADTRTLQQVVFDEWGVTADLFYLLLDGKPIGLTTRCDRIPVGATVQVRGKLRGGTGAYIKKLRGLLQAKGVPPETLDSRVEEVRAHIGDKGIKEAYDSFDPWAKIKNSCNFRLVKEAEAKSRPKQKEIQKDDGPDPMQVSDPWAQALKERKGWKLEPGFFRTTTGATPAVLEKLTHGSSGIAIVSEREAEILIKQQDKMSSSELAAIVIGSSIKASTQFSVKDLEIPCRNQEDNRVLVRAQLINLGDKEITVVGEESKITIDELDGAVLSCEILRREVETWDEIAEGPIKFLRKRVPSLDNALFSNWGRRFFAKGKPVHDPKQAESCFLMLRIKREFRDAILKVACPGIYLAPRTDNGAPDHVFKVVWFPDQSFDELLVLANAESKSFGLVRNKSGLGIRVKADDFTTLRQKWQPSWQPQAGTPYGLNIKSYFDVQNLPVSCSKNEVQKFLNTINWNALVIRQTRPRVWLVGAEAPPTSTIHLAEHGTILITERAPKGQGKGKTAQRTFRDLPWIVAGSASSSAQAPRQPMHMELDTVQTTDLEDKFQKKIDQLQREHASAQAMIKEDLGNLKESFMTHKEQQSQVNQELQNGVQQIKADNQSFSHQLTMQLAQITAAIQGQKADFAAELKASQGSLKEELMQQVCQQVSTLRKRTPSPPRDGDPKKQSRQ